MRIAICTVVATAWLATAAQARDLDAEARAALAVALSLTHHTTPSGQLCPCSLNGGLCDCSDSNNCGCPDSSNYRWIATSNSNQTALYRGNVQVGNYWHAEKEYRRLEGDRWTVAECPVLPLPVQQRPTVRSLAITPTTPLNYSYPFTLPVYSGFGGGGGYRGGSCGPGG